MLKDDLKAKAVWPLSELQSQNRWTNAQSITGRSRHESELREAFIKKSVKFFTV